MFTKNNSVSQKNNTKKHNKKQINSINSIFGNFSIKSK